MFLSTTTNNLDVKGRVSVPSDFRAVVVDEKSDGIFVWPDIDHTHLIGGGRKLMEGYRRSFARMKLHDDGRVAFAWMVLGQAKKLSFDANGRVTLPKEFIEAVGLSGQVSFVGLGDHFEIWNPEELRVKTEHMRVLAREHQKRIGPIALDGGSLEEIAS